MFIEMQNKKNKLKKLKKKSRAILSTAPWPQSRDMSQKAETSRIY